MATKRSNKDQHTPLSLVEDTRPTADTMAATQASEPTAGPSEVAESAPSSPGQAPQAGRSRKVSAEKRRPQTTTDESTGTDLGSPEYYLNRELTWLAFNRRVLHEAGDERTPLLERLKFLAIAAANLDEFFMKRIGGLKQQVGAGVCELTVDGRSPQQQIEECYAVVREIEEETEALLPNLLAELEKHGIAILSYDALAKDEQAQMRAHYIENIFPLVTPQAVDSAHPFPFISTLSLNLLVSLAYTADDDEEVRARVKVPLGADIPRFLPVGDSKRFVALEQIMSHNLDLLFPNMDVRACELFHVTRNANTDHDEESADDLLAMIESEVRERRFAPIVRIKVERNMDPFRRGMIAANFGLDEQRDVFYTDDGMLAKRDLWQIALLPDQELHYLPHYPVDHPKLDSPNIFYAIRDHGPILVQHPYESFSSSVERFLLEASNDPKVRAVKMTLYRTSGETRIVDYLIEAAQNGKQVAVVVELKASFDETANIRWASRMEEAGIHVTYGVVGLKTHCKLVLVVRRDYNGLRLYTHIGTGNYHAGTARLYDDLGLFTCNEDIGRDLIELFNYLTTGYTPKRNYRKILPAPKLLKRSLIAKIRREIALHSAAQPGLIQMKMNALEDPDITRELYLASQAGVRVDLLIRDTCRLRPGIPGVSENVRIISMVGRFLEHSRIYYFHNGGDEEYYIGSADSMMRNLEHRVEVLVPVEDTPLQAELRQIIDLHLNDQRSAWDMRSDGTYVQRRPSDENGEGCQEQLIAAALRRHKEAKRLKRRKPRIMGRRNVRLPAS
ncbi:polyphosphate kinase 1 [Nitrococcus mobilis]|uniref:Polyphosphate kinase n=1 Tax=Nitrococcus mobilis Nb-231 TaxID=314278 RepID=A4BPH2_9GAMM|nr:polyphosphate kinase 1 [Nitrococcus mobilis]EAR22473.1 polyphosphate kinase [Nitrococcus mobilis Nb-231]